MVEKGSVLIVDDDEGTCRSLSLILERCGYETETVRSGREAKEKAEERFFNVALIDIRLPDMSGIEVLKTFRRKYPSRMNIMISGYATLQNSLEALNLGANAYIMKPIDPEELDMMLKECLQRQRESLKLTRGTLWKKLETNVRKMQQEDPTR